MCPFFYSLLLRPRATRCEARPSRRQHVAGSSPAPGDPGIYARHRPGMLRFPRFRTTHWASLLVAAAALFWLGERPAQAYPQWQLSTGAVRCNQCHYAPAGGGLINSYGRDAVGDELSSFGGNGAFLHGAVSLPSLARARGRLPRRLRRPGRAGSRRPDGGGVPDAGGAASGGLALPAGLSVLGVGRPARPGARSRSAGADPELSAGLHLAAHLRPSTT